MAIGDSTNPQEVDISFARTDSTGALKHYICKSATVYPRASTEQQGIVQLADSYNNSVTTAPTSKLVSTLREESGAYTDTKVTALDTKVVTIKDTLQEQMGQIVSQGAPDATGEVKGVVKLTDEITSVDSATAVTPKGVIDYVNSNVNRQLIAINKNTNSITEIQKNYLPLTGNKTITNDVTFTKAETVFPYNANVAVTIITDSFLKDKVMKAVFTTDGYVSVYRMGGSKFALGNIKYKSTVVLNARFTDDNHWKWYYVLPVTASYKEIAITSLTPMLAGYQPNHEDTEAKPTAPVISTVSDLTFLLDNSGDAGTSAVFTLASLDDVTTHTLSAVVGATTISTIKADIATNNANAVHITGNESISGVKTFNNTTKMNSVSVSNAIYRETTDSYLHLRNGTGETGAYALLYGSDHAAHPGWFDIGARTATGTFAKLVGTPDGFLGWNGKELSTKEYVNTEKAKYLPLIGGQLKSNTSIATEISLDRDDGYLAVRGCSAYSTGASLYLSGLDTTSSQNTLMTNGAWMLHVPDKTNNSKFYTLRGTSAGELLWNGSQVMSVGVGTTVTGVNNFSNGLQINGHSVTIG